MINIWTYSIGDKIKITDCDDAIFIGRVEAVTDAEERSDLCRQEDGIYIITEDGKHIEIKYIHQWRFHRQYLRQRYVHRRDAKHGNVRPLTLTVADVFGIFLFNPIHRIV